MSKNIFHQARFPTFHPLLLKAVERSYDLLDSRGKRSISERKERCSVGTRKQKAVHRMNKKKHRSF